MPAEDQFINKLGEIPIVHDGWNVALDYYSRVKDYNSLTKYTLGAAECSLKKAAELSTPVLTHYQPQIDTVNTYACNKLDEVETKYPLIKQPTEQVKDACVEYVQPVINRVKPVVTYVNGVVDNTQKTVGQLKQSSTNLVTGARDLGVNTVSQAVKMTLETPPGRLVTNTMDFALSQTDSLIDKYIPEEQQEGEDSDDESAGDNGSAVEQMQEMPASPARLAAHFMLTSTKLRRRLHQRARQDFNSAKIRTMTAISQLQQTLDVREYAKTNLGGAYSKAQEIWGEINEPEDQHAEVKNDPNATYAQILERRIVTMGRIITRQVRSGVTALEKASTEAGLFVKNPISKSREYKDLIYQFGSENLSGSIEKARDTITYFQKRLQSMIDNLESPEWLGMDIDMDGIDLAEDDTEGNEQQPDEVVVRNVNHI